MCGIVGFVSKNNDFKRGTLEKMNSSMAHRGPDSEGYFFDANIGIAMSRLKIIDLETGNQPIFNEKKDIAVILNGEIYNFKDIKKELISKGHAFKSKTDTEVIVHGYEEWGIGGLLEKINGMYAFCVYDQKNRRMYIARDRIGEKPLYYYATKSELLFASELKTLLTSKKIPINISKISLFYFLALHYVPGDMCIIQDVKKLLPGHYIEFNIDKFSGKINKYWELREKEQEIKPYALCVKSTRKLVENAVKLRTISDVPIGIFLSGGIDSSIIVAIMSQLNPHISTFSIGFENSQFDESEYSKTLSKYYKTDHHHFVFDQNKTRELLPNVIEYMDEPCGDQALLPVYWLAKEAKKYATVVLGGEGGDEIFAGYSYYPDKNSTKKEPTLSGRFDKITNLIGLMGGSHNKPSDRRFFSDLLNENAVNTPSGFPLISDFPIREKIIKNFDIKTLKTEQKNYRWVNQFEKEIKNIKDDLRLHQYVDIKSWLPDNLLMKYDKMLMAHSLEGRAPYLDYELVEFAYNLPAEYKIKGNVYKFILREAFKDKLPKKIFNRKKQGFNLPMSEWLKNDFKDLLSDIHNINYNDGINNDYLKILVDEHLSGKAERGRLVYSLLIYKLWIKYIFEYINY